MFSSVRNILPLPIEYKVISERHIYNVVPANDEACPKSEGFINFVESDECFCNRSDEFCFKHNTVNATNCSENFEKCFLLHWAARKGNIPILCYLLQTEFCMPDITDNKGSTPLHEAICKQNLNAEKVVHLLLYDCHKKGIAVANYLNKRNKVGLTALILAIREGCTAVVHLLLKCGANPNEVDFCFNKPALFFAIEYDRREIVQILIKMGARVNERDQFDYTPLHEAIRRKRISIIPILIQAGCDVNSQCKNGTSPIHLAIAMNLPDVVDMLSDAGASWDLQTLEGYSALHIAVQTRSLVLVKRCLQHGVQINLLSHNGVRALWHAVHNSDLDVCELLVRHGARLCGLYVVTKLWCLRLCKRSATILHIIELLLVAGIDVNCDSELGSNLHVDIIHSALSLRCLQLIRLLLAAGAKLSNSSVHGK